MSLTAAITRATDRAVVRYLALARRERWDTLGAAQRVWASEAAPIVRAIVAGSTAIPRGLSAAAVGDEGGPPEMAPGSSPPPPPVPPIVVSVVNYAAFEAMVWNRIVSVELPATVFSQLISITTTAQTLGWSPAQIARRIAVDLAWTPDTAYWDAQRAVAEAAIEARLSGLSGAARDLARTTDPIVHALQDDMAYATRQAEAEYSQWRYQAERIARTEGAAASNFAALRQLEVEGWTHKQWVSTHDSRTRDSHRLADGQVVPIGGYFDVGGYSLAMPGDYAAPAAEVIHCRCTLIGTMGEVVTL